MDEANALHFSLDALYENDNDVLATTFRARELRCRSGHEGPARALRHESHATRKTRIDGGNGQFLRTVRVERAARLLRDGAGNVTEVAYSVGFNSLSYFHRAFRERFGVAPSEYASTAR